MLSTYFSCVPTYIPCVPSIFPMHSCIYFMQSYIFSHWYFTIPFPTTVMLNMSIIISLHCKVDFNMPNACFRMFSFELYFFQSYQIQCIFSGSGSIKKLLTGTFDWLVEIMLSSNQQVWLVEITSGGCHGRYRMVVWFTNTYAISAYHHHWCEFESWSGQGVQN